MSASLGAMAEAYPLLYHGFPGEILGVRLAGDDELHRALGIGQEAQQPLGIM